ncbi:YfhO family protein [Shimazuella kribbensis]|uniref:YfhO family protein n=1 Tax=Shimazuella kribbensis TaxID=139808 RepID=UPI000419D012|nr:YfhO family protein [Shimazuella kribbensis]
MSTNLENNSIQKTWWLREHKGYAVALAAILIILSMCISGIFRGSFPFGDITRSVNDLGNQFVPIHTYYWDMLHGQAEGDLFYNWRSAFGTGFYADFVTYLSSPFELLVYFFPRSGVNLAVYVITVAKLAAAGAAMAFYLTIWKRGSWVFAGLLGASYALCGWAIDDSAFVPMWLDGLIAFPLICLVGQWALERKHIYLGTFLVLFIWISNFYTAYMATLGAAIVILIRMFTEQMTSKDRGNALLRGIGMVALGIGMAMPLIYPILKATGIAQPTSTKPFEAVPWAHLFSRLFPITEGIGLSPSIFIGTPALLFAFAFLFQKQIVLKVRMIWSIVTLLVLLSFQWNPTQLLWHAFAAPNGSSFREAFIFCGMMTMLAWMFIRHIQKQNKMTLLGAALLFAILMVVTSNSPLLTSVTFPIVSSVAFLTVGILFIVPFLFKKQLYHWGFVAISLILLAFVVESAISTVMIDQIRYNRFTSTPEWNKWHDQVHKQIVANNKWPVYRTETGTNFISKNDPLLLGGQGIVYYSSLTMKDTTKLVTDLGFGWDRWGRGLLSLDNEVTDAIFSIGARIHATTKPDGSVFVYTKKQAVPQLVTVHPSLPSVPNTSSVFLNQEKLLGSKVYEIPKPILTISKDTAPLIQTSNRYKVSSQTNKKIGTYTLQAICKPNSIVYLHAPHLYGTATLLSEQTKARKIEGSFTSILAPIMRLGKTPPSGKVTVIIRTYRAGNLSKQPIACLDQKKFQAAIEQRMKTDAISVQASGHTIRATLPKGSTGSAIIAIPNAPGWMCSKGGKTQVEKPLSFMGLMQIPLDQNTRVVSCEYQPPGWREGLLLSLMSFVITLFFGWWMKRKQ